MPSLLTVDLLMTSKALQKFAELNKKAKTKLNVMRMISNENFAFQVNRFSRPMGFFKKLLHKQLKNLPVIKLNENDAKRAIEKKIISFYKLNYLDRVSHRKHLSLF